MKQTVSMYLFEKADELLSQSETMNDKLKAIALMIAIEREDKRRFNLKNIMGFFRL